MKPLFFGVADILNQCAHFDGIQHDGQPLRLPVLGPRPLRNATYFVVGDLQLIQGRTYMCLNSSTEVNLPSMLRVGGRVLKGRIEESVFTVSAPDGPFEGSLIGIFGTELILRDVTSGEASGRSGGNGGNTPPAPVVPLTPVLDNTPFAITPGTPATTETVQVHVEPTIHDAATAAPIEAATPVPVEVTPPPVAEPIPVPVVEPSRVEVNVAAPVIVKEPQPSLKVLSIQCVLPFPEEFTPEPGLTASAPAVERSPGRLAPAPRVVPPAQQPEVELTLEDPALEPVHSETPSQTEEEKVPEASGTPAKPTRPVRNLSEAKNGTSKTTAVRPVATTRPVSVRSTPPPVAAASTPTSGISEDEKEGLVF